jgi:nitrite reductase/ring-hydroxylating ferredoxin subunit
MEKLSVKKSDLHEDVPKKVEIGGKAIAVILHKGKVYAINAICTHKGGPLDEGKVEQDEIICPWHHGRFNIMTGKANSNTPWVKDTQ